MTQYYCTREYFSHALRRKVAAGAIISRVEYLFLPGWERENWGKAHDNKAEC